MVTGIDGMASATGLTPEQLSGPMTPEVDAALSNFYIKEDFVNDIKADITEAGKKMAAVIKGE